MKTNKLYLALGLLLCLALLLVACGGKEATAETTISDSEAASPTSTSPTLLGESGAAGSTSVPTITATGEPVAQPTATQTSQPTEPPEPTEEPDPGLSTANLAAPENLTSYRSTMTITTEGKQADGSEVSGTFTLTAEWVREPPAQHITITGAFPGAEDLTAGNEQGSIEMYQVDGTMYMYMMGNWLSMPAEETAADLSTSGFVASHDIIDDLKDAKYEGKKTYNGVMTRHYTFNEKDFDVTRLGADMTVTKASGDVYVAVDGEYVVHMTLVMEGKKLQIPVGDEAQEVEEGSITIVMDLLDVNAPIEIIVPEEALAASKGPEDIPIPDNAEDVQAMAMLNMVSFSSASSTQEVAEYYKTEMPNYGWTEVSFEEFGGMYTGSFTKQNRTANIMINWDEDKNKTSVMITTQDQQ